MRVPRAVARFNRRITNPVALRVVDYLPALGILQHIGRRSGKHYRTPLLVFDTHDGYAVLVGYGPRTNWVRNVLAGGEAAIRKHGRTVAVGEPILMGKAEAAGLLRPHSQPLYRLFPYDEAALVLTKLRSAG